MNMEQLRYVLEIEKQKSMSKASKNLFITQQNLSYAIKKLEDELDFPILDRYNKGCSLTDEGMLFSEFAKNVLEEWDEFQEKLAEQQKRSKGKDLSGEITLYINKVYETFILPEILGNFAMEYPNIVIKTVPTDVTEASAINREENFVWLLNLPKTTKEILYGSFVDTELFEYHTLFSGKNVLCVNEESPLAGKNNVSLKTAMQYPLIYHGMTTKDVEKDSLFGVSLQHHGDFDIKIATQTGSYGVWLDMIASGKGIGLIYDRIIPNLEKMYPRQMQKIVVASIKEYLGLSTGYAVRKEGTTQIEEVFINYLINNCS